jgi:hypothetical protein
MKFSFSSFSFSIKMSYDFLEEESEVLESDISKESSDMIF